MTVVHMVNSATRVLTRTTGCGLALRTTNILWSYMIASRYSFPMSFCHSIFEVRVN